MHFFNLKKRKCAISVPPNRSATQKWKNFPKEPERNHKQRKRMRKQLITQLKQDWKQIRKNWKHKRKRKEEKRKSIIKEENNNFNFTRHLQKITTNEKRKSFKSNNDSTKIEPPDPPDKDNISKENSVNNCLLCGSKDFTIWKDKAKTYCMCHKCGLNRDNLPQTPTEADINTIEYDHDGKDKDQRPILDSGASHSITPYKDTHQHNNQKLWTTKGSHWNNDDQQVWYYDEHYWWSNTKCIINNNYIKTTHINRETIGTIRRIHRSR